MTKSKKIETHLFLKQTRSVIGKSGHLRAVMKGLGLRKIGSEKSLKDTPAIRGMVEKVQHMVQVEVREGDAKLTGARSRALFRNT
jgi:large subunit ribosomal protein L30